MRRIADGYDPRVQAPVGAWLLRGTALQVAVLIGTAPAWAQPAPNARPTGGVVVGGAASIGQGPGATTITQTSQRAAIDWGRFDVGRDQVVVFQQPGSAAVTLNRVLGPDPSQIAGRIQANGQVVITNQSGVMVHKGAQIDTAGLVVSAAGIAPAAFMAGSMAFDQAPRPDAQVSNAGAITIRQAGLAALVAPRVANSGVIQARLGRVVLAGAETHTIDLYGDGLLSIDVTRQVRQAPRGADGAPATALVTNTGAIVADGGTVTLTAAAADGIVRTLADGIVRTLVQAGGRISAGTVNGRAGTIVLEGVGGSLRIEGRVAADGGQGVGGAIVARATGAVTVAASASARVTANGATGGGSIAIGSRGTASVTVEAGARIAASARGRGNGGTISVVSGGVTTMNGRIAVRGGAQGGNGGAVEISGATLGLTGTVDGAAPAGRRGTLLIDPTDIVISKSGGANTVAPATLEAMTTDITLTATSSVIASDSVTLTQTGQSMTLNGGNFVRIDPTVTLTVPGGLNLLAGAGGVSILGSLTTGTNGFRLSFNTTGPVTQGAASVIKTADVVGAVGSAALTSTLNQIAAAGSIDVALAASTGGVSIVDAMPLTVIAYVNGGGITGASGSTVSLTADTLRFFGRGGLFVSAPGGTIALQPLSSGIPVEVTSGAATTGALSIPASALPRLTAASLSLGSVGAGALTLAPDAVAIDFGGAGFATLSLASRGAITQAGAIAVPNLVATGGSLALATAGNVIPAIGGITVTGEAALSTTQGLAVNGAVKGANVALSSGGGGKFAMTLNASVSGATVGFDTTGGGSVAASGPLVQTAGFITAKVLQGRVATATFNLANAIASVGDFHTAKGFALTNAGALSLTGALLNDAGAVTLNVAGAVAEGAAGSLSTPALTGTAQSLSLTSASNLVQSLQGFSTSVGGLALTTGLFQLMPSLPASPLSLAGVIAVPTGQSIAIVTDRVTTAVGASIAAPGGSVSFAPLTAGTPVELVATAAEQTASSLSLTQADVARIQTATLTLGSAASGPILVGQANDALSLVGTASTLSLLSAGAVTEGTGVTLAVPTLSASAASLAMGGANAIGTVGAVTTTGDAAVASIQALTLAGPVAVGGAASFSTTGGLVLTGTVSANSLALTAGAAGISQTGGSVDVGTLSGTSAGGVALNAVGNYVATLVAFTAGGDFSLADSTALAVAGAVQAGGAAPALSIAANALTLQPGGTLSAPNGTVALGPVTAGAPFNLTSTVPSATTSVVVASLLQVGNAATGPVTIDGAFNLSGAATLNLVSTGAIAETGSGALTVNRVTATGSSLTLGGANAISQIGPITTTGPTSVAEAATSSLSLLVSGAVQAGGPVTLRSGGDLVIQAGISAPTVGLYAGGAINEAGGGFISANSLMGTATTVALTGTANQVATVGPFNTRNSFALTDARSLVVTNVLDPPDVTLTVTGDLSIGSQIIVNTLTLNVSGAITEAPTGAILAATLTGGAASVALGGGNSIATLGPFSVANGFSLFDIAALTVAGPVNAGGAVSVTGLGPMVVSGRVTAPTIGFTTIFGPSSDFPSTFTQTGGAITAGVQLTIVSGDAIAQTGGAVATALLTGSSSGATSLSQPGNAIGGLGRFTAAGALTVATGGGLVVTGPVQAASLSLGAKGAVVLQGGSITSNSIAIAANGLSQTGATTLAPLNATTVPATLNSGGGPLSLAALSAPAATMTLVLGTGAASGTLNVGSLTLNAAGGSASLSGSVSGQQGFAAAIASRITPAFNTAYTLNGCAIASVTCSTAVIPPPPPPVPPPTPPSQTTQPSTTTQPGTTTQPTQSIQTTQQILTIQQRVEPARPIERIVEPGTVRPDLPPFYSALRPDLFTADLIQIDLSRNPSDPDLVLPNISDRDY